MKLLTKELEKKFEKYPLYSQDGKGLDAEVIAKFYNPYGHGTWLITEGDKQEDGDYLMFGYVQLSNPHDAEFGYVTLKQLESIEIKAKLNGIPFTIGSIERDIHLPEHCNLKTGYGIKWYWSTSVFNRYARRNWWSLWRWRNRNLKRAMLALFWQRKELPIW